MSEDKEYNKVIESVTPLDKKELFKTEKEYGFSYRQGIRELLYAMVTCHLDISFPLIKLIQHSSPPARGHFQGIKGIFNYLRKTITKGIYFWRKKSKTGPTSWHNTKLQRSQQTHSTN